MRDAQARIDAEGLIVADAKGNPIPHPAIALERAAQSEVRAWGDRFSRRGGPGRSVRLRPVLCDARSLGRWDYGPWWCSESVGTPACSFVGAL